MRERSALVIVPSAAPGPEPAAARWRRTRSLRVPVVAALAPAAAAPAPRAPSQPRRALRSGVVLLLAGLGAFGAWRWSAPGDAFSERLGEGCEQIEACRQLEAEAAQRVQSCWLGCGRELSEHRMARLLRYRAEERSAVHEHYRQRADAERSAEQLERDQKLAEWQREQAAHSADAEREQHQELELERLRQDRFDQRLREERQRRVAYLALLGSEARSERLEHCHTDRQGGCDALVLDLIDAAPEAAEKRKLAALNEQLAHGVAPAAHVTAPKPAPSAPNS